MPFFRDYVWVDLGERQQITNAVNARTTFFGVVTWNENGRRGWKGKEMGLIGGGGVVSYGVTYCNLIGAAMRRGEAGVFSSKSRKEK
jgi:hypothetical protein